MNKAIIMGRLTRDAQITRNQRNGGEELAIARYTLAVERRFAKNNGDNQQTADFISCVAFGKAAEFVEKYCRQGTKLAVVGRIQTGSYTNKDGQKVYTTEVVVEEQEFAESKKASNDAGNTAPADAPAEMPVDDQGYLDIPDNITDDIPFPFGN